MGLLARLKAQGKFDWMSNPQYLAQIGHVLGGYGVVLTPAHIGLHYRSGFAGLLPALIVTILGVLAASYKEFVFDIAPSPSGEGDSWSDSIMDWAFYMLGAVVCWLVLWKWH